MQGASGYKIYRTKYASNGTGGWTPEKVDVYYKDAGTSGEFRISEGEGTIDKKTTCTSTAGVYTLRDAYADSYDDTNPYSVNQSQIAWGLPYSYTVIPVLSEDDFSGDINLETNKFELSDTCKVAYNGIGAFADKVKGSAFGYGLNLNASKASDTKNVSIIWTEPYGSADKVPYLYRRSYNDNNPVWSKVPVELYDVSNNNRIGLRVNEDDSDRCEPFDYLVSYDPQTVSSVHNSFIKEIERNENLDENGERACKGYAFTLPGITAKTGTGYSEEVYWEAYDYSKRAQGPESYEIFMRNDNKKDGWVKICTLKAGNNSQNATLNTETVDKGMYDIDLDFTGLSFTVQPSGIASGNASNTNGLLKVLRDAKHYYKIEAARKAGGTDIRASYGNDKSVYAYREITDEELVKSTMLILSKAVEDSSINEKNDSDNNIIWIDGYKGQFETAPGQFGWLHERGTSKFNWYVRDYVYNFYILPGSDSSIPSFLMLSDPNTGSSGNRRGKKSFNTIKFLCYDETKTFSASKLISVDVIPYGLETSLQTYSGTVKFAVNKSTFVAEVWRNGLKVSTLSASGEENVKNICPINIDGNGYNGDNSSYGWWED